jgi:hypothetical protein
MGNGALPHGPSYRAHPRLYRGERLRARNREFRILPEFALVGRAVLLGQLVEQHHVFFERFPAELGSRGLDRPGRRAREQPLREQLPLDRFSVRGAFLPAAPALAWFRSAARHWLDLGYFLPLGRA